MKRSWWYSLRYGANGHTKIRMNWPKLQSIDDGEPSVLPGMCAWGEPVVLSCDPNER
jgi:hypothetical protein